jgi:hypothetical protein
MYEGVGKDKCYACTRHEEAFVIMVFQTGITFSIIAFAAVMYI